jgi:hypothetical protein
MEERIAAPQGNVTSAGAVDVTGFAAGYKSVGSDYVQCLTGVNEFSLGQLAQVVARRLQRELTVSGTNICAEMHPRGTAFGNRAFPTRSARHEVVETEMAEFMTAIGGEHHVTGRRSSDQRTQ